MIRVLLCSLLLAPTILAQTPSPVSSVAGVSITVDDLGRELDFFTTVLDCKLASRTDFSGDAFEHATGVFGAVAQSAMLTLGDERIELLDFLAPEGRPIPSDSRSNDRWFQHIAIVVSDMDAAYARLRSHNVRLASAGLQTLPDWNKNAAGIKAFYFKDPEGHVLELIWFPPGKGDPRWQQLAARADAPLFLGIDHTAIVVADTETSLSFYRDTLGLRVAGASENFGPQQERLNNVFGARLRITTLKANEGPGVELLEYLSPATGREAPVDAQLSDHWSWRTVFLTAAHSDLQSLRPPQVTWISPGAVNASTSWNPVSSAIVSSLTARDPDRHALVLIQSPPQNKEVTRGE